MKRLALCADDYGMTPEISSAILALAEAGRIQACSCLVTSSHWPEEAPRLTPCYDRIDIGLHLNLTEGAGLSPAWRNGLPGLERQLLISHLRGLSGAVLLDEINRQLDRFIALTGRSPDFIDGHQHVHQLPQVRDALLRVMAARLPATTWVRSVTPLLASSLKAWVIENSGARPLRRQLLGRYSNNSAFAGVYNLSPKADFRVLMQRWLRDLPDGGLIMCHPTDEPRPGTLPPDHAQARLQEYRYLQAASFVEDCHSAAVQLTRPSLFTQEHRQPG